MQKEMALVLSGMFARTNYGMSKPTVDEVACAIEGAPQSARSSMEWFCAQFIESDEHEEMFAGEAKMWYNDLIDRDVEDARAIWPDMIKLYEDASAK